MTTTRRKTPQQRLAELLAHAPQGPTPGAQAPQSDARKDGTRVGAKPWQWQNDAAKSEAIRLLARGHSVARAAKMLGRTPSTLYEWIEQDPAFARAFNALAKEKDDEALEFRERVRRMSHRMLDEIESIVTDTSVSARDRNVALSTFFSEVHNPMLAPKAPQVATGPQVFISAEQAHLLFAPAEKESEGAS